MAPQPDPTDEPSAGPGSPGAAERQSGRGRLRRRALTFLGLLLGLVAALLLYGVCGGMIERSFIYFPERDLVGDPGDYGLAFDDVTFTTDDGVELHGWFVPGDSDVTWLWFHGNAGNISDRLENLRLLHDELAVSVFLIDYRSYGRSEGSPSEEGTYRDAETALAYLLWRPDVDPNRIVYFGRSLGAGVAVELATQRPPHALILESPVPSIPEMVRYHYRFLPIGWLIRTKYDSLSKIGDVRVPLLVLHGDRDEVVPFRGGQKLFEAANEPKQFYTIEDAGHNDTVLVGGREYFQALREFVESLPQ